MFSIRARVGLIALIWVALWGDPAAADRVALVIGNAQYSEAPALVTPGNDAQAIGAALERAGFRLHGGQRLKTLHRPERVHYFLSSPQGLM